MGCSMFRTVAMLKEAYKDIAIRSEYVYGIEMHIYRADNDGGTTVRIQNDDDYFVICLNEDQVMAAIALLANSLRKDIG
jgi:hypothetical protein